MQLLWDCVEHGWENVWKNKVVGIETPVITDVVAVSPVNLSKYDLLAGRKAGV
jgi:hypothetical protein